MTTPKIYDIIRGSVNDDPVEVQNAFSDLFLNKVRDVVDDRRAQLAASFLGGQTNDDQVDQDQLDDLDGDLSDLEDIDLTDIDELDSEIDSDDNSEQEQSDETT